jgi:hypothetical protein
MATPLSVLCKDRNQSDQLASKFRPGVRESDDMSVSVLFGRSWNYVFLKRETMSAANWPKRRIQLHTTLIMLCSSVWQPVAIASISCAPRKPDVSWDGLIHFRSVYFLMLSVWGCISVVTLTEALHQRNGKPMTKAGCFMTNESANDYWEYRWSGLFLCLKRNTCVMT